VAEEIFKIKYSHIEIFLGFNVAPLGETKEHQECRECGQERRDTHHGDRGGMESERRWITVD
jgi:hypothetical protein